jgi:tRNA modification GTPase
VSPEATPEETIVARASGEGPSAVALIRLAGARALSIARECLPSLPPEPQPQRLYFTALTDSEGEPLDEVFAAFFARPRSYTGEDVVEIYPHGGRALVAAVEQRLVNLGARRAEPGEFTRRAVDNGKMDLVDAEALAVILAAESEDDLTVARLASGEGARELRRLVQRASAALAEARGAEDHPVETEGEPSSWRAICAELAGRCRAMAAGASVERRLSEGHRVVLMGPVNAGKSSLFNALLGERRALVDSDPGTTRDAVSATISMAGKRVTLYDTAGLRPVDGLEGQGVAMGLAAARVADLVIWVDDGAGDPAKQERPPVDLQIDLRIRNKVDLRWSRSEAKMADVIDTSAVSGFGISEMRERILALLSPATSSCSARQQRILRAAADALDGAKSGPDDCAAASLERAVTCLHQLVGGADGDIEAEVYRRFCIGK